MSASEAGTMVARLWCRVVGHKWVFMPGVSHGHDELYECRRCGGYDWRDLPAADKEEPVRMYPAGRPAAAPSPTRR